MLTLTSISTIVLWFNLIDDASTAIPFDMHCMGFAMSTHYVKDAARLFSYRDYPSLGIRIQLQAMLPYTIVIVPIWSLFVTFSCYPFVVMLKRAKRRRYVERAWFAVTIGMSTWAFVSCKLYYAYSFWQLLDRQFRSEYTVMSVSLAILVFVPAICAILIHNVIAGPLCRASLRKPRMCVNCGYNLTGNVSGRCSECGTPVS